MCLSQPTTWNFEESMSKYSDDFMRWLKLAGYTHCFFVAGGNAMHLIESASYKFDCIPFINEVGAAIAADSFNEICRENQRAFVLVTAGPGLTNVTTAVASAWVDRRELLVIGGQAKSTDLSRGKVRQLGFQEIGGVEILSSITKKSVLIDSQIGQAELNDYVSISKTHPKGPVFLELCLDVTIQETKDCSAISTKYSPSELSLGTFSKNDVAKVSEMLNESSRPVILIGGGVDRHSCVANLRILRELGVPLATTFNGADRIGADYEYYCGRPNWYGSRWANLIIQQADLVIALGARLGLMQTGYNWREYVPNGKVVQIEIEHRELSKGFPKLDAGIVCDPNEFLRGLCIELGNKDFKGIKAWQNQIQKIRRDLALPEKANLASPGYVEYYSFTNKLMSKLRSSDNVNPCSSGGSFESFGRIMLNKTGQKWVTSPGLASMGFGISGGIGMALAYPENRTVVFEGDGGLAQNMQEFGVIRNLNANIKVFIADNGNYGSIKSHQKAAFNNHYVGCDKPTGLWLPEWEYIGKAFGIPSLVVNDENAFGAAFTELFEKEGPAIFIVKVDPDQLFYPKILSAKQANGEIVSNPLHMMEPPLSAKEFREYAPYLTG
jgi:acetolactate synthase-1/2/3 large subunit